VDECGECVGGDTGKAPCSEDCAGEFGGNAFVDVCGECVDGGTRRVPCDAYADTCTTTTDFDGYVVPMDDGRWRINYATDGVPRGSGACCFDSPEEARSVWSNLSLVTSTPGCTRPWAENYDSDAVYDGCLCELAPPDVDPDDATLTFRLLGLTDADNSSPYRHLRYGVVCGGVPVVAGVYDDQDCTENQDFSYDCPSLEIPLRPESGATCRAYVRQYLNDNDDQIAWEFGGASYSGAGWAWTDVD
jgi:hypothetical protein